MKTETVLEAEFLFCLSVLHWSPVYNDSIQQQLKFMLAIQRNDNH